MFSTLSHTDIITLAISNLSSANAFDLSKVLSYGKELMPHIRIPGFNNLGINTFENIVGKGKNAGNQHFLF